MQRLSPLDGVKSDSMAELLGNRRKEEKNYLQGVSTTNCGTSGHFFWYALYIASTISGPVCNNGGFQEHGALSVYCLFLQILGVNGMGGMTCLCLNCNTLLIQRYCLLLHQCSIFLCTAISPLQEY